MRLPHPISERWATMVTIPSVAIDIQSVGSNAVADASPSAAHTGDEIKRALKIKTPLAKAPCRNPRRLTFSRLTFSMIFMPSPSQPDESPRECADMSRIGKYSRTLPCRYPDRWDSYCL